jgi:hypothetical protein
MIHKKHKKQKKINWLLDNPRKLLDTIKKRVKNKQKKAFNLINYTRILIRGMNQTKSAFTVGGNSHCSLASNSKLSLNFQLSEF